MVNGKSLVFGVVVGSVVGASISLLTAPNSGEEFGEK